MAKPVLDSDLYGDIYGDEFSEFLDSTEDEPAENVKAEDLEDVSATHSESPQLKTASTPVANPQPSQDALRSLPAKPSAPSSKAASLSYSAQIAKQFSAYQQTPSQERQQRFDIASASHHNPALASSSTAESIFGKKPSEMHDTGKMFIGGLNWDTTDERLRDYFAQFGKVDACTIMRDPTGTSRGFAFLTFEDQAAVEAVLAREHSLDGKAIDPKRAIPREEHLRNTRYFVGGLSHATTSESMRVFFSTYGKVVDATMMIDRETGRSKGFGFVTFEDASNADQLVGNLGLTLDDKQIEVKLAQPRSQRDSTRSLVNKIVGNREPTSDHDRLPQPNATQTVQTLTNQVNPMAMFSRPMNQTMNQMSMMGNSMPMMNVNPMMAMGMGMNPYLSMASGMPAMNMMSGMGGFAANAMGNAGSMRLGMGPMGNVGMVNPGMLGLGGLGSMGTGFLPNGMASMAGVNGRMGVGQGLGPSRITNTNRKQHNFHPYAR